MNNKTILLIENIISIPLWLMILFIPSVMTQWTMTKGAYSAKFLKKANYLELKKKMYSIDWTFDPNWPNSLWDKNGDEVNRFHASIFVFDNVGYLLTPFGLIMANIYQRRIRKSLPAYTKFAKPYID